MQSAEHRQHTAERVSHNYCNECRADCERQYRAKHWPGYRHVAEYISYIKPRLAAIASGERSADATRWYREFIGALHRRIAHKIAQPWGRKHHFGYTDRLEQYREWRNGRRVVWCKAVDLRHFAARGASTLLPA